MSAHGFEHDLIVIGGGSGGLAAAKRAAELGASVVLFDYVDPSPRGSSWGLGGTCPNVGCIPKKLCHTGALLGESIHDSIDYGWNVNVQGHDWETMINHIQKYVQSMAFDARVQLREYGVKYVNAFAQFRDAHTIIYKDKKNRELEMTAETILIAVGGRPNYPDIPGAREYCITSDDVFQLTTFPGKTLVVGASYVALECAGFLSGVGCDTTVMMRSIPLRGFDQDCAERIVEYMTATGTNFIRRAIPTAVSKNDDGKLSVTFQASDDGTEQTDEFDTVLMAIGRNVSTSRLLLDAAGVEIDQRTGKIPVSASEQTNIPNIYAIGDVCVGRPELTPVAIQAGRLLANRLFGGSSKLFDYKFIPTTVFTPLEYGSCGLSEDAALEQYGADNLEIYRRTGTPLEYNLPDHRLKQAAYFKLICVRDDDERVVGFHILTPNAAEMTQGFALALRMGARKEDFDDLVGIHPSVAELLTTMKAGEALGSAKGGCST